MHLLNTHEKSQLKFYYIILGGNDQLLYLKAGSECVFGEYNYYARDPARIVFKPPVIMIINLNYFLYYLIIPFNEKAILLILKLF